MSSRMRIVLATLLVAGMIVAATACGVRQVESDQNKPDSSSQIENPSTEGVVSEENSSRKEEIPSKSEDPSSVVSNESTPDEDSKTTQMESNQQDISDGEPENQKEQVDNPPSEETENQVDDSSDEEVKNIVLDCLARADEMQKIYLGEGVETDDEELPTGFVPEGYRHVSDSRINSLDLVYQYFRSIFDEVVADRVVKSLFNSDSYTFANKKIYFSESAQQTPLTTGKWKAETVDIISATDSEIVVEMQTTVNGADSGTHTLKIIRGSSGWLLTDSYFFE